MLIISIKIKNIISLICIMLDKFYYIVLINNIINIYKKHLDILHYLKSIVLN